MSSGQAHTIVIPAYEAWATLPVVLDALAPQAEGADVLVVDSTQEPPPLDFGKRWPWARLVRLPYRALPGSARNVGAALTRSDLLIFLDADMVPCPGWLDELRNALSPELDAVSGAVLNGRPRNPFAIADYLLEYSHWTPHRRRPHFHGASGSMAIRRKTLEQAGGFPELWPGEDTILTFRLAAEGRFGFARKARVRHLSKTTLRGYLQHQRGLGTAFPRICEQVPFPGRVLSRPWLAPFAGLARLVLLLGRSLPHPRQAATAIVLLPVLALGLAAWATGVATQR